MNKSNFKQIFLTLALLITAATGAWAEETITVTWTLADLQADAESTTFTKDGVTIQCDTRMSSGKSFNSPVTISTTLGNFTKIEITGGSNAPIQNDNFTNVGNVSTWTGNTASLTLPDAIAYANQFVFTIAASGPEVTLNEASTVATIPMPESDVTVEYELVRDLAQQVTFGGIPTGDGLVVKNNGTAYEFVTTPDFTLTDALAATDAQNIISAEGITIIVGKMVEVEGIEGHRQFDETTAVSLADFLANPQPGTYKMKATATADGPYDGTVTSAEFTLAEKYDLLIQPADEYSKDKLSEVTVAGTAQTLDADGKATVPTESGKEVKLKAKRGYVIEKVEARKKSAAAGPVTYTELNGGEVLKVGDILSPSKPWNINSGFIFKQDFAPYTVLRANLTTEGMEVIVTPADDGAYYVVKAADGYYSFYSEGSTLPVTATSDGISVTFGIDSGDFINYTFSVHEP